MTDQRAIPKSKSWTEYRAAFDRFSIQVRKLQVLTGEDYADPADVEAALIAVELARQNYNATRDALARDLMLHSSRGVPRFATKSQDNDQGRVKAMAELFWDLTGRHDGADDENWYRAENIVRRADSISVCC
jgi:hypothetical protein